MKSVDPGVQKETAKVNQNFSTIEIIEDKKRILANRASMNSKEGESDPQASILDQARFSIKNSQIFSNVVVDNSQACAKQEVKLDQIVTQNDEVLA